MNLIQKTLGIVLALMFLCVPAVAVAESGQATITGIVNELLIQPDTTVLALGYTVNDKPNVKQYIAPGTEVLIRLNNLPEGGVFKAVAHVGDNDYPFTGNPIKLTGIPWTEAVSIPVELTVTLPPGNPETPSQGSSVILNPAVSQPQGIYTAPVENGSAAQFPTSGIIFQVIMPDGYSGEVVLTTYKTPLSLEGTAVYHQCDISIDGKLTDGETAFIRFKIPLSVLEARELTAADACLYHSDDGGETWDKCPTVYEVRGDMVYYTATVDGFSPFKIVFEKDAAKPADSPDAATPPADVESPGFGAVVVLAGLGAVLALRRR